MQQPTTILQAGRHHAQSGEYNPFVNRGDPLYSPQVHRIAWWIIPVFDRGVRIGCPQLPENPALLAARIAADDQDMGEPQRVHTYDDDLHDRRRRLAAAREPIDFEAERLRRLVERARDTRDP